MNKSVVILILATVVLGITFFLNQQSVNDLPDYLPTEDEKRAISFLKLAERTCLSGSSTETAVGVNLIADFEKEIAANSRITNDKSRGAIDYLDEKLRSTQDNEIRECIEQYMPQITACLLGDCSAYSIPNNIEFQFVYNINEDNENLVNNLIAFGIENRANSRMLVLQPGKNYYVDSLALPSAGQRINAAIYRVVNESFATQYDKQTKLCITRSKKLNANNAPHTRYICAENGDCILDASTPQWFEFCENIVQNHWQIPSLISKAYASNTNNKQWIVPSLDTLKSKDISTYEGYTQFTVSSAKAINIDADGYFFDLSVNDVKTRINGLDSHYNVKPINKTLPLSFSFGLQNLNFAGKTNGCDEITLNINFVKNGERLANPINIKRSYVALRNARTREFITDTNVLTWQGTYNRADPSYDTEVFINSILVSKQLNFSDKTAEISQAQTQIDRVKKKFNQLNLTFEGEPLVAVTRPPLTKISYGLAVGVKKATEQIQFTFAYKKAKRLLTFLKNQRNQGQKYRAAIREDSFLYSIRGNDFSESPPICWDESLQG